MDRLSEEEKYEICADIRDCIKNYNYLKNQIIQ
jgi:hypothetical protein